MSSHMVFQGVNDTIKSRLESYWQKKSPRLEKLLTNYRPDLVEIRVTVSHHQQSPQRSLYEARGVIQLPTGTLVAEAYDKFPEPVLDRLADDLVQELRRHKELVRRDYLYKRKGRRRADVKAALALLQKDRDADRKDDFFHLLRPLLSFLGDHARREINSLEQSGLLHRGEVEVADVMDEVLTLAWERFPNRPTNLPFDLWLTDLLNDALEKLVKEEPRPPASLEERADQVMLEKTPKPGDQEWWVELLREEEQFTVEDLIPDWKGSEAWEELSSKEQRNRLYSALAELPTQQRQAFLLNALEDYSTSDIAKLQGRSEREVKEDIESARQALRERLLAGEPVQEPAAAKSGQ